MKAEVYFIDLRFTKPEHWAVVVLKMSLITKLKSLITVYTCINTFVPMVLTNKQTFPQAPSPTTTSFS